MRIRIRASFLFSAVMAAVLPAEAAQRVVYMNGMITLQSEAQITAQKVQSILDTSAGHIPDKRDFIVTQRWNAIGWYGTTSFTGLTEFFQDSKELFIQKTYEEWWRDAYKSMLEYIKLGMDPYPGDLNQVTAPFNDATPGMNSVECKQSPPEDDDCINDERMFAVRSAVADIMSAVSPGNPAVIIAHSQANLIVNEAYAMLVKQNGWRSANQSMQVVNLANTSGFSINGLDITHAGDNVLFGSSNSLVTLPSSMPIELKRFTPREVGEDHGCGDIAESMWAVCDFKLRGATFNAPPQGDWDPQAAAIGIQAPCVSDPHSVDKTYLSTCKITRSENATNSGVPELAGTTTFARYFESYVYRAAEQLGVQGPIYPTSVVYGDMTRMFPNNWTGSAVKTTSDNGATMRIAVTQTNMNIGVTAQNFGMLEGVIRLRAKHRMHAGYDAYGNRRNFFPSFVLVQGSTSTNIGYTRSTYAEHYCYDAAKFNRVRISFGAGADDCILNSGIISSDLYDSMAPIETVFVFNTRTGTFRLTVTSGSAMYPETFEYTGVVPVENRLPITGMRLGTYGWYTGHYHDFYNLSVEQVMP